MRIYNCHAHIFNFACAPNGFLSNYIGRAGAAVAGPLLRVGLLRRPINWLLRNAPFARKYAALVRVGTSKSQDQVLEDLAAHYPEGTALVALTIDFDQMAAGEAPANYRTQLELVRVVKRKYPDTCLPFLCIDPRSGSKGQLRALAERYFNPQAWSGFVGIKLYPSLGFYPFHHNLEAVYAFAEEHGIPIMTHCTRGGIHYVKEPMDAGMVQPISFNPVVDRVRQRHQEGQYRYHKGVRNADFCDNFLDPVNYLDVLEAFPRLKLCFAHYGGDDEMLRTKPPNQSWYRIIRDELMIDKYPNVYADVSYTLANKECWGMIRHDLAHPRLGHRILFGTDYFMTLMEPYTEKELYTRFQQALSPQEWERLANTNPRAYLSSDVYQAP